MMRVNSVNCFQCESHPYTDWYRYGSGRYRGLVGGSFYGGRYLRNSYGDDYYYGDRGRGSYSMNGYLPGSTRSRYATRLRLLRWSCSWGRCGLPIRKLPIRYSLPFPKQILQERLRQRLVPSGLKLRHCGWADGQLAVFLLGTLKFIQERVMESIGVPRICSF